MAAKCDVCGKMAKKYHTSSHGDTICNGICWAAYTLESMLLRMEERRAKDEQNNQYSYNQYREMSAWLSVYRYGNAGAKKKAGAMILAWYKYV